MTYRPLIVLATVALAAAVSSKSSSTFAAPKEPRDDKASRQRATTPPPQPIARPRQTKSCAEFGAGFTRMPGSDSCVRIGGGIDVGVGSGF
jgi:hypothetical protein